MSVLKRALIKTAIILVITLTTTELTLAVFDPLGVHFLTQMAFMNAYYTGPIESYRLAPGQYDLGDWQATVNEDQTRAVPDSGTGDCRVTFFGDSVTWGWGVDDEATFVDQLARRWPDVQTVNAGTVGYNSQQVRDTVERSDFDLGVYLVINDDAAWPQHLGGNTPDQGLRRYPGFGLLHGQISALRAYYVFLGQVLLYSDRNERIDANYSDWARFEADITTLAAREDMRLFAFDAPFGQRVMEITPVHLLPPFTTTVSRADAHPNPAGHAQIAADMEPVLEDALRQVCQVSSR